MDLDLKILDAYRTLGFITVDTIYDGGAAKFYVYPDADYVIKRVTPNSAWWIETKSELGQRLIQAAKGVK